MSLGRYIVKHRDSSLVALNGVGRAIGYLAGCLENPTKLDYFNDIAYFRYIEDPHFTTSRFVNWAEVHSVPGVQVVTSSTSRSIPFYRRLRFTELRVFPWNSETAVCMGRQLADGR